MLIEPFCIFLLLSNREIVFIYYNYTNQVQVFMELFYFIFSFCPVVQLAMELAMELAIDLQLTMGLGLFRLFYLIVTQQLAMELWFQLAMKLLGIEVHVFFDPISKYELKIPYNLIIIKFILFFLDHFIQCQHYIYFHYFEELYQSNLIYPYLKHKLLQFFKSLSLLIRSN